MWFFNRFVRRLVLCVLATWITGEAEGQYVRRDGMTRSADPEPTPAAVQPVNTTQRPARASTAPAPRPTETRTAPRATAQTEPEASEPDGRVEINADRLEYDADRRVMVGVGNVEVRQFNDILRADYIEVHTETQDTYARGNVYFERDGRVWQGQQISYNFQTRTGDFGEFHYFNDPYYVRAGESQQPTANVIQLKSASITTCSDDQRKEFIIRARSATITDGHILRAKNVVVSLYGMPLLYTPYLKKDFTKRSNFEFTPGYSSRMGAFLLTSYNFYPLPHVRSSTMVDYRAKRGFGGGQQFRWRNYESGTQGRAIAYYLDDDLPIRGDGQRRIREGLVDNERYWLGFRHSQSVAPRKTLMTDINYVSDPFVLEDFFDRDFRRGAQPENRVTLTHRGDNFTAALLLNMRLNDFYDNVNRLPEASLDISRQELGASGFYYEGQNSAARLERVYPEQSDREDYDAVRIDSLHTVLYPMRHFGFLSVIPSVGYRGTYYSETARFVSITNLVAQVDEEGNPLTDEEGNPLFDESTETTMQKGSAELRSMMEFGVETSFKAFKVLSDEPNYMGQGLRHVAEPYAKYTLVPEPNVTPSELYQFDAIDRLDERHDVRFGMRNKLQTRRLRARALDPELNDEDLRDDTPAAVSIHDFIDLDVYTVFRIDPNEDENDFTDMFFDARVAPTSWMRMKFDGAYDWYESEIRTFNTQLAFFAPDRSSLSLEYRYDSDRRQTVQSEIVLFPQAKWSMSGYWRFDLAESELQEQTYLIERRLDCTRFGIGVRGRLNEDDEMDWRAWAQVTLLAFPEHELRIGR